MKRNASIDALLDRCDRDLSNLEKDYANSLARQSVSQELKIDIKNLAGNLRSVLDYLAADIRGTCCPTAKPSEYFYFPALPSAAEFVAQASKWYPGLAGSRPDIWSLLESAQPYQAGREWLGQLNRINNENKHEALVEQTRVDTPRVTVSGPAGGSVSWDPRAVTFGAGVYIGGIPVNPATQLPVPHPHQKVEKVVWVDFRFKDPDVSVLQLLRSAVSGVRAITLQVSSVL